MKVVAVIQARMGSSRLKGKSLMMLSKYTLLETVVRSVKRNNFINRIIVATTNLSEDDSIERLCVEKGFEYYRGDSLDVLSRFIEIAASLSPEDTIVRVTADNPVNNNCASKRVFEDHISNNNDYTCVKGLSHTVYEFVKVSSLLRMNGANDLMPNDREHVTMYLRQRPEIFKTSEIEPESLEINTKLDKLLTVDREEDYKRFMDLKQKINIDDFIDINELYQLLS